MTGELYSIRTGFVLVSVPTFEPLRPSVALIKSALCLCLNYGKDVHIVYVRIILTSFVLGKRSLICFFCKPSILA